MVITTACSASTQAFGIALNLLQLNKAKRVIIGGSEALCNLTKSGFSSMMLVTEDASKPFDSKRDGISLSEGAAYFCLENSDECGGVEISGHGSTCDAFHMTAPAPRGDGCRRAIEESLKSSTILKEEISWVHAHGTGSTHNDLSEGNAIADILTQRPPVSSTKFGHGHTLGASGALEVAICYEALMREEKIRTFNLNSYDPQIEVNHCTEEDEHIGPNVILKTTLGFGGVNVALLLKKVQKCR